MLFKIQLRKFRMLSRHILRKIRMLVKMRTEKDQNVDQHTI